MLLKILFFYFFLIILEIYSGNAKNNSTFANKNLKINSNNVKNNSSFANKNLKINSVNAKNNSSFANEDLDIYSDNVKNDSALANKNGRKARQIFTLENLPSGNNGNQPLSQNIGNLQPFQNNLQQMKNFQTISRYELFEDANNNNMQPQQNYIEKS